jgi:hypothetical protein
MMYVTEVAHDQFQEGHSGCVTRSIGYDLPKIKADRTGFLVLTRNRRRFGGNTGKSLGETTPVDLANFRTRRRLWSFFPLQRPVKAEQRRDACLPA